MTPGGSRNVAILHGHALTLLLQQVFLISPNMRYQNVKTENAAAECVHQPPQPILQNLTLSPIF